MIITINEQPADISLENERSLKEIMQGLDTWLKKEGFFMSSVILNGKAFALDEKGMENISVDKVERLDIFAHELQELFLENTGTLYRFLFLLRSNILENNTTNTSELIDELPYILSTIDSILGVKDTSFSTRLDDFVQQADFSEGIPAGNTDSLLAFLNTLIAFLENRIQEKINPVEEFHKAAHAIESLLPRVKDTAVLLQTGKDKEAMETLGIFSELCAKMIRLFGSMIKADNSELENHKIGDKNIHDFYAELNGILQELLEAMETDDSVLIGDLLEYEVAPRLEELLRTAKDMKKGSQ